MPLLDNARQRLSSVLSEIELLKDLDFPYSHSREGLEEINRILRRSLERLDFLASRRTPPDTDVVNNYCMHSLTQLYEYLPLLGFISRSTSVRNAFETYGPLLSLAVSVLDKNVKLILSSEWDYSPFAYALIPHMPSFVLIGLPASESANPLLLPLAGHELGHSVWLKKSLLSDYSDLVEKRIVDEINNRWKEFRPLYPTVETHQVDDQTINTALGIAHTFAVLQLEEIFCDLFGLRIFAESYLYAFEYLVAPRLSGPRPFIYPNVTRRVRHLLEGADKFGIEAPTGYVAAFEDQDEPAQTDPRFLVSLADTASESIVAVLIDKVDELAAGFGFAKRSDGNVEVRQLERDALLARFRLVVPPTSAESLPNLINAAWICARDPNFWKGVPQITPDNRENILRDLVLKSIEVLEIEQILGNGNDSEG